MFCPVSIWQLYEILPLFFFFKFPHCNVCFIHVRVFQSLLDSLGRVSRFLPHALPKKKSHSQHIQKGRMTQTLGVVKKLYACCSRLLGCVENVLFFTGRKGAVFVFIFLFFFKLSVHAIYVACSLFYFQCYVIKKTCTIIKLISGQSD